MTYTLFERYSGKFYDEQAIANVPNEHSMNYLLNCFTDYRKLQNRSVVFDYYVKLQNNDLIEYID